MWLLLSVIVLGIEQVSKDGSRCGFYEGVLCLVISVQGVGFFLLN